MSLGSNWIRVLLLAATLSATTIFGGQPQSSQQRQPEDFAKPIYDFNIETDPSGKAKGLPCVYEPIGDLTDDCALLKVFNQSQVDSMGPDEITQAAERCACQLIGLYDKWKRAFDDTPDTRQVAHVVSTRINETLAQNREHPSYFWSDIEIAAYRVSVYTSTRNYFDQLARNSSMRLSAGLRKQLQANRLWLSIGQVCRKVTHDRFFLYRYLENLQRLSAAVFFRLIIDDEPINMVYQASKACKMLLLVRLNEYRLRPDDETIVVANRLDGQTSLAGDSVGDNSIAGGQAALDESRDIDTMIYRAKSSLASRCSNSNATGGGGGSTVECPIDFDQGDNGDNVKIWLERNPSTIRRSLAAIQCGCELLLYNSTWDQMIADPDVSLMAKVLTNYMNNNRVPDFSSAPVWVLYGWFDEIMSALIKHRKMPIREVMRFRAGANEDPTGPMSKDSSAEALELLRRGCLVVDLNYNKQTKSKGRFRLVKYLDDLQSMSSDQMFVFQLTLQDINLFKIYALSKMCQPIR